MNQKYSKVFKTILREEMPGRNPSIPMNQRQWSTGAQVPKTGGIKPPRQSHVGTGAKLGGIAVADAVGGAAARMVGKGISNFVSRGVGRMKSATVMASAAQGIINNAKKRYGALRAGMQESLSEEARKNIPKENFVYKGKKRKGHSDKGKYPIDTIERARSALRLVGMHGTPAEKSRVRAAVKAKWGIGGEAKESRVERATLKEVSAKLAKKALFARAKRAGYDVSGIVNLMDGPHMSVNMARRLAAKGQAEPKRFGRVLKNLKHYSNRARKEGLNRGELRKSIHRTQNWEKAKAVAKAYLPDAVTIGAPIAMVGRAVHDYRKFNALMAKRLARTKRVAKVAGGTAATIYTTRKIIKAKKPSETAMESRVDHASLREAQELIPGGRAEGSKKRFSPKQLRKGRKVEKEHTPCPKVAEEIARDHLTEIPDYYDWLEDMEDEAKEAREEGKSFKKEKKEEDKEEKDCEKKDKVIEKLRKRLKNSRQEKSEK